MSVGEIIKKWLEKKNISIELSPEVTLFGVITIRIGKVAIDPNKWNKLEENEINDFLSRNLKISLKQFREHWTNEIHRKNKEDIEKAIKNLQDNRKVILRAISDLKGELLTGLQKIDANLSKRGDYPWLNKVKYNDKVIRELESKPTSLRAILMGPHFLHPPWMVQRRQELEPRRSFGQALQNYLLNSLHHPERDVRLIVRNSIRYLKYLEDLKISEKIPVLIKDMKRNLHTLFPAPSLDLPTFCCTNPGYILGFVITDKSCFIYTRLADDTPLVGGYHLTNQNIFARMLSNVFDEIFNNSYLSRKEEITRLENYIELLGQYFI